MTTPPAKPIWFWQGFDQRAEAEGVRPLKLPADSHTAIGDRQLAAQNPLEVDADEAIDLQFDLVLGQNLDLDRDVQTAALGGVQLTYYPWGKYPAYHFP